MPDSYDELPILYALGASGALMFVDDVENGIACGCTCPDPNCGQALVARNAGTKRIHHFAHKRGGCSWSVDNIIVMLAADAVTCAGRMAFPSLDLCEEAHGEYEHLASARTLRVSDVSLQQLSGRGAPEMVVTCPGRAGSIRQFVVVVPLTHVLTDKQVDAIVSAGYRDVVVVDLRRAASARKKELGKHFDRYQLVAEFQDPALISSIMLDERWPYAHWERNERREAVMAEREKRRAELAEAQRAQEAAKAEEKRREREERERLRAEQAARAEAERQRMADKRAKKEAERLRREQLMSDEGQRAIRSEMLQVIDQQEIPARDALGRRWFRCELCGKVAPEDEFSVTGGRGKLNLGKCRACLMKTGA